MNRWVKFLSHKVNSKCYKPAFVLLSQVYGLKRKKIQVALEILFSNQYDMDKIGKRDRDEKLDKTILHFYIKISGWVE